MDAIAAEGIILDRFYTARFCTPSRSSFQSGRNAIHSGAFLNGNKSDNQVHFNIKI